MYAALDDHEESLTIGSQLISDFRFADDAVMQKRRKKQMSWS